MPTPKTDPGLVIGVVDLRRRVGEQLPITTSTLLDDVCFDDAQIDPDKPVHLGLVLESISGGISCTGTLRATAHVQCRRCCEPQSMDFAVAVDELFEERSSTGESYPIANDEINLAPMVRELVALEMPRSVLCSPTCPGPAPEKFPVDIEDDGDALAVRPVDPRWAGLAELRLDDPNQPG